MDRVKGKTAIVTGAGGALGRAIAIRLAEEGASVVANDINEAALGETVAIAKDAGHSLIAMACDVTEERPVAELVDLANRTFGRVDILVNNVGGSRPGRIWDMKVEDFDFVLRLNLRSAFLCTRAVVPQMMERRSGRIIGLSSGSREGSPWIAYYRGSSVYAATKAGVHGFTRNVALELGEYGITVNAVAPGPIETERSRETFREFDKLDYGPTKLTPLRRLGQPGEVADAVLFLASDEASYITGVTLNVTGGR